MRLGQKWMISYFILFHDDGYRSCSACCCAGLTFFSRQLATAKFANAVSVNKAKTLMDVQDDVHR